MNLAHPTYICLDVPEPQAGLPLGKAQSCLHAVAPAEPLHAAPFWQSFE